MRTINRIFIICLVTLVSTQCFGQSKESFADMIKEYEYKVDHVDLLDGQKMAYVQSGTGDRTLILIHGLATYIPAWYPTIESLDDSFSMIAVDLPGYGKSDKDVQTVSMSYYADAILQLIEKLQVSNPTLVGHSMGAQVAITAALKKPNLFQELILLAPAGFETFNDQQKAILGNLYTEQIVAGATDEQIRASWALNFYEMPSSVEFMIEDRIQVKKASDFNDYCKTIVGGVKAMLDAPVFDKLKLLKPKTLVIYGENDNLIPNKYINPQLNTKLVAENGAAQIENNTLVFIPECGHFISYDQPQLLSKEILKFLSH